MLRKFWSLNYSGILEEAKGGLSLAQASTRSAARLEGNRAIGPALLDILLNRMVTDVVQLIRLLLKERMRRGRSSPYHFL